MALPAGITPKTVTIGIASFFDGSLADGTATITAPVNVVHTPTNRPIFSSTMSQKFVDGVASFTLAPTDAPGLNRVDWTYKLNVAINGALVQPDPIYFTLPAAGPDTVDLDGLVTVPSSAGVPISVDVLTVGDVTSPTSDVSTALRAAYVPKWKPSTAYAAGEYVLNPSGQVASAKATFTSGTSYSAANWTVISGGTNLTPGNATGDILTWSGASYEPQPSTATSLSVDGVPVSAYNINSTPLTAADVGAVSPTNAAILSKIERALRSKIRPNQGIAVELNGTSYRLWQRLSPCQWMGTYLDVRTNTNGGPVNIITQVVIVTPSVLVSQGNASITQVGTWTTSTTSVWSATATDSQTYTTPANTTGVGVEYLRTTNGGLSKVSINGDSSRARGLPTAQDLVERGTYPATILTTGSSSLSATLTASSDLVTTGAVHGLAIGSRVVFGTPSVANGLVTGQSYYVRTAPSTTTLTLAATPGGPLVDITADSTATATAYGILNPTDRVIDHYWGGGALQTVNVLAAEDLPPTAGGHVVVLNPTGYQQTASTGARAYFVGFLHRQAQVLGDTTALAVLTLDGGAGSATEYAISAKPPAGAYSFMGCIHDNEAQDSISVTVDGVATTLTSGVIVKPTSEVIITRTSHLLHPNATGSVANIVSKYILNRDGIVTDETITWAQPMTVNAAYSMLPLNGKLQVTGSAARAFFDRGDLLENASGPLRIGQSASDLNLGISKSAAAWAWDSQGRVAAGMYVEDILSFTNNWGPASGNLYANIEDRNGTLTKVYVSRVGSGSTQESVVNGTVWAWRTHYLFGLMASPEAVFAP